MHVIRPTNQPVRRLDAESFMHSRQPIHRPCFSAVRRCFRDGRRPYRRPMRTELPAERLHRRLGAQPSTVAQSDDNDDPDTDPNSLLPRWVPDGSAQDDGGWLAKVRADPGRAGAIALAAVAAIAVLVTIFTLMREHPPRVASAKLPPVDMAASASRAPSPAARSNQPVVVSVVGLVHTPG